MGTGGMVMADGETGKVDLIPTRLHIGNGKDTPPCHQLCNETIESSQVRPSAMIATITGGDSKWLRKYRRRQSRFPLRPHRVGPQTALDTHFTKLKKNTTEPAERERRNNN